MATRIVVCVLVLGAAIGIYEGLVATKPVLEGQSAGDVAQRVLVFRPQLVPVRRHANGFGTAAAIERAEVPARVASTVVSVPPEILAGAAIRRGSTIAILDDSDFQRELEMTNNTLADVDAQLARLEIEQRAWQDRVALADEDVRLARADADRVRRAQLDGAAKDREIDQAAGRAVAAERAAVATREELDKIPARRIGLAALRERQIATQRLAQQSLDRCRIASPIDGVLQAVNVKEGESVVPGQAIARVVNLSRIEVPLMLPASARGEIGVGDDVTLFDETAGGSRHGRQWSASVARIAPEDDASTRTMTVFAELVQDPSVAGALAPGRFVQGVVVGARPLARMLLPRRAVRSDRVFTVSGERVARREVVPDFAVEGEFPALGLPDTAWVALRDPLPDGDLVVLDGSRSLEPGVKAVAVFPESVEPRAGAAP